MWVNKSEGEVSRGHTNTKKKRDNQDRRRQTQLQHRLRHKSELWGEKSLEKQQVDGQTWRPAARRRGYITARSFSEQFVPLGVSSITPT